jgi:hypothetical protein
LTSRHPKAAQKKQHHQGQAAEVISMFSSFFTSFGNPGVRRSSPLQVETLEGRDMPSALPVLAAPPTVPPPSPIVHVSVGQADHGAQINEYAKGASVDSGAHSDMLRGGPIDWSHAGPVQTSGTRSSGEEIPQ